MGSLSYWRNGLMEEQAESNGVREDAEGVQDS